MHMLIALIGATQLAVILMLQPHAALQKAEANYRTLARTALGFVKELADVRFYVDSKSITPTPPEEDDFAASQTDSRVAAQEARNLKFSDASVHGLGDESGTSSNLIPLQTETGTLEENIALLPTINRQTSDTHLTIQSESPQIKAMVERLLLQKEVELSSSQNSAVNEALVV